MKFQSILVFASLVGSAFSLAIEGQTRRSVADPGANLFARTDPLSCVSPQRTARGVQEATTSYADYDLKRPDFVDVYLTPDALVYFGNGPPLVGREAFRAFLEWQWSATSYSHQIEKIIVLENLTLIENVVTYHVNDGTVETVKAFATWIKAPEDTQTSEIKVWGDFSTVFAKFVAISGPPPS